MVTVGAVRHMGFLALVARPRRELLDQRELLRRIRGRVALRQHVVHFRPRLNRNVLADLLRGCRVDSVEKQGADETYLSTHGKPQRRGNWLHLSAAVDFTQTKFIGGDKIPPTRAV